MIQQIKTAAASVGVSIRRWWTFQRCVTISVFNLQKQIDIKTPGQLKAVLVHHFQFFAAVAIAIKIFNLLTFGKVPLPEQDPLTLQYIAAFLGVIPTAAAHYLAGLLFPRQQLSFIALLTICYAIFNIFMVSVFAVIAPLVLIFEIAPEPYGDYVLFPFGVVLITGILSALVALQSNVKIQLKLGKREFLAYTLVSIYLWIPLLVFFFNKKAVFAFIARKAEIDTAKWTGFFKYLDDLML